MADISELIAWCRVEAARQRQYAEEGDTVRQRRRNKFRAKTFGTIGDELEKLKRFQDDRGVAK